MKLWLRVGAVLLIVWLLAAGTAHIVHSVKPTPESLIRYVEAHSIANAPATERRQIIDKVVAQLNRLTFEERRTARTSKSIDEFFRNLTDEERNDFLDRTLPEGFRQMMLALNKMTPEKRKALVERALSDLDKANANGADPSRRPIDQAQSQKIIQQGMSAFYEEANADVKMDFAPVIEQMQRTMQSLR